MILEIPRHVLADIYSHGEKAYPEEGAGLLLGEITDATRRVLEILTLANVREDDARHNRYLLSAEDYMLGEAQAAEKGLDVLGVFHSHPDHPNEPSEFDRQWAWPSFSYLITSVMMGKALASRSWRLTDDRARFVEEEVEIVR
jgi:proteasome lid subunit RPN8/RPN11